MKVTEFKSKVRLVCVHICGVLGDRMLNSGYNHLALYYGSQCENIEHFGLSGGPVPMMRIWGLQ